MSPNASPLTPAGRLARARTNMRRLRRQRLEAGLCGKCGKAPHREHRTTCADCGKAASADTCERAEALRAAGLCPVCKGDLVPGRTYCAVHLAVVRERSARHAARRRAP